jgi:hypothetical protein
MGSPTDLPSTIATVALVDDRVPAADWWLSAIQGTAGTVLAALIRAGALVLGL